jgi:DNA-binding LacI/PurR family transcriptional regulator
MLRWWRPAMTVVDHDPQQIAQLGAELLLERMRTGGEPAAEPRRFPVGARLISRDSCGPAQNASRFSRKVGRG